MCFSRKKLGSQCAVYIFFCYCCCCWMSISGDKMTFKWKVRTNDAQALLALGEASTWKLVKMKMLGDNVCNALNHISTRILCRFWNRVICFCCWSVFFQNTTKVCPSTILKSLIFRCYTLINKMIWIMFSNVLQIDISGWPRKLGQSTNAQFFFWILSCFVWALEILSHILINNMNYTH